MKKGFSIVEIVVVTAIGLILLTIVTGALLGLRDIQALNSSVEQITSVINEARAKTLASENFLSHSVHFEMTRVVLFEGMVFAEPNVSNKELKISDLVEISSVTLNGGGQDLIFQKLTGETGQYGIVTVRLKKDVSQIRDILIKPAGIISVGIR